jgi:putative NIF3 family GTP cyclohydrolase 1 type 2
MQLKAITSLLETKLSPKLFKLDSEVYGIQYGITNPKRVIKKILISLNLSLEAIHYAFKNKINLIISYQGLINSPIEKFNQFLVKKLSILSKYPLSIFVLNSSFIAAEEGISETIMNALYLNLEKTLNIENKTGEEIPLGRVCTPIEYPNQKNQLNLEGLIKRVKNIFEAKKIFYVGDLSRIIKKCCIVGGNNSDMKLMELALEYNCDCFISSKIRYEEALFAKEIGLNLIEISHYKSAVISLKKLYSVLSLEFPYEEFFFVESEDPLQIY